MLVEFTVGNFRSIAEKVTLSMVAGAIKSSPRAQHLDENNLIWVNDKLLLLKTTAIYGANASGKSNILTALTTMGTLMEGSVHNMENKLPFMPFLLISGYQNEPSHFEVVFLLEGIQHRYGFEISASQVVREWLYFVPNTREALLFRREGGSIKIGENFKGGKGLEARVAPQALFLTVARDFNVLMAKHIFKWLSNFPAMSGLDHSHSFLTIRRLENKDQSSKIIDFMTSLDMGISDIEVSELSREVEQENFEISKPRNKSYKVETIHTTYDRQENPVSNVRFNLRVHESEGTQKLFSMSGMIVDVLRHGYILAIDEMDAKLHPSLTRKIVELFQSKETNQKNAQLIFATHDTNLLDNSLFRRDQIWFAEKKRTGATDLYSLAELKVRNDVGYEKEYIDGRYGAIPFPGGFKRIFNENEDTDGK